MKGTKAKLFQESKFFVNRLVPAEHFRPVWTCTVELGNKELFGRPKIVP